MAWALDESESYADAVMGLLPEAEILAPGVWPLEAANAILVAVRRKRLSDADGGRLKQLLRALPITVVTESPVRVLSDIFPLARELGLSSYDASYLHLAQREGVPLATLDAALRSAARRASVSILASPRKSG
jgi:predicted nucleic acid-binding protein